MALNITTPITISSGLILNTSYVRLQVFNNVKGDELHTFMQIYPTKSTFVDGYNPIECGINPFLQIIYDRSINGTDELDYAHDCVIAQLLAEYNVIATKEL